MPVPREYDYEDTDEIVCPYCGNEQSDSWEHTSDSGDTECGSCFRLFHYYRDVSVSYTSRPIIGPHRVVSDRELEWQRAADEGDDQ